MKHRSNRINLFQLLVFAIAFSLQSTPLHATGDFVFESIPGGGMRLTGYNGLGGNVVIPLSMTASQ
ncbi:MAG: hypothetical protein LR015_01840 [Verrucomicrobia bacterium]|nr:hypothetical protein [Verrucomicrobiota bacterium]